MNNDNQDEVIVDNVEENNEEVEEQTEDSTPTKVEKPKRTPQEELEYFEGRAARLRKKLGADTSKDESTVTENKKPSTERRNDLSDGQIAILRTEGIKSKAEIALFKEVMAETGKGVLDLLDSSYFQSRLTDFRANQESLNAIPKGKNRSGQAGVTDIDIAFAKFKETGQLPEDFQTRVEVINRSVKAEKAKDMFSGPSVVGYGGTQF